MRRLVLIFLIGLFYYLPAFSQHLTEQAELVEALNSPYDEFRPCIAPNGKVVFFSRKGHPLNVGGNDHYDVWVAYRKSNGDWGKAVNLGTSVNDKSDNIVIGTNTNADKLYLVDDEYGLTFTQKKGRSWSIPKPVQIENFKMGNSKTNFHVSGNGLVLILSMPAKGNYGGRDLYFSTKIDEVLWSAPQNLGPIINSSREEYCAALAEDGKTLYFLSNGHDESPLSGDLFMSRCTNSDYTEWEPVKALGINLNPQHIGQFFSFSSENDDVFCSAPGENGDQELFEIPISVKFHPEPTLSLSGRLLDAETGVPIRGKIKLRTLSAKGRLQEQQSKKDGSFRFILPRDKNFGIYAETPGYFARSETMNFSGAALTELDQETMTADYEGSLGILSPEAEQLQLRLNKVSSEFQQLAEMRRKEAQEQAKRIRRTKGMQRQSDPELESLKHKYVAITGIQEVNDTAPEKVESDAELEAMKRKFRKHNDVTDTKAPSRKKKETELEAMKRKFNQENSDKPKNETEDELMNITVSPSETEKHKSFDQLVDDVWYDLEGQLIAEVSNELKTDLIPEVASEIKNEMDDFTRKGYVNKFQRMATVMESESKKELRRRYRAEVKRELKGELIEVVEEELRETLRDEVKQELRLALESEVRQELRMELEYQIKKEIIGDLQKELKAEVKQSKRADKTPQTPRFNLQKNVQSKGKKRYKERETLDIKLYKLSPQQIIPLNNVFFKANEAVIQEDLSSDLNRVLALLEKNPKVLIEIGGHTNGWCSVKFAQKLSSDRAKAIAEYLIENGANPEQILHNGYGRSRPIVPNDSLENCKKNQRIELKIIQV